MSAGNQAGVEAACVLVAAGTSTRMGTGAGAAPIRKPLLELAGRPLLEHACAAFDACESVREIVIVAHPDDLERIETLRSRRALDKVRAVVPGGAERADSVRVGARATSASVGVVAVHDAARPLVRVASIERTLTAAGENGAALLAVPVRDTIKSSPDGRVVDTTLDRSRLWSAQTPQAFRRATFLDVLDRAEMEGFRPTDDAALWERYVGPVTLVPGEPTNLKVTTPDDLAIVRTLFAAAPEESVR